MNNIIFKPLTREHWKDFEVLFGSRGACGGCWCMLWRLKRSEFEKQKGDGNKRAMRSVVNSGHVPGILAYLDDQPVGWCAIGPRDSYPALDRSRVLKRLDDEPVWSITCFFVAKRYRRQGVSVALLRAAIEHVRKLGGRIVEGYAVEPRKAEMPDVFAYSGLASAFRKAGFTECVKRSETRPIMRFYIR